MALATEILRCLGVGALATAAFHATLYVPAAWRRRRAPATDPCEADRAPRAVAIARLVLAETVASFWLALAAVRPGPTTLGDPTNAQWAVLLVGPAWLPARSLSVLGRRLARPGVLVGLARVTRRADPAALARIAARADALRRTQATRPLVLVFYGGASAAAGGLLALLPRGVPSRVLLLAPSLRHLPGGDVATVTIWGDGDPWQTAPGVAVRPTIALEAVGHLALLVAPHVADVMRDACLPTGASPRGPLA